MGNELTTLSALVPFMRARILCALQFTKSDDNILKVMVASIKPYEEKVAYY